jgi:hypothetical protein
MVRHNLIGEHNSALDSFSGIRGRHISGATPATQKAMSLVPKRLRYSCDTSCPSRSWAWQDHCLSRVRSRISAKASQSRPRSPGSACRCRAARLLPSRQSTSMQSFRGIRRCNRSPRGVQPERVQVELAVLGTHQAVYQRSAGLWRPPAQDGPWLP